MAALEIEQPDGETKKLTLRQPGEFSLQRNPKAAVHEFKLLEILASAGLPVPTPYHVDERGELVPAPFLIMEYIEGEPKISTSHAGDAATQMAEQLAHIHGLTASRADLSFLPRHTEQVIAARPPYLDVSLDEERIRKTLEAAWPLPQGGEPVLLHGDYWPGNVIWRQGRIAAVVDWSEASLGDRLRDVSISRLDILWAYGSNAMHSFTTRYQTITAGDGIAWANLPYWDLCAALRPVRNIGAWAEAWSALGRSDITEATMRAGHRTFITEAFQALGVQSASDATKAD